MHLSKKILYILGSFLVLAIAGTYFYRKNNAGEWVYLKKSKITDAIYGLATLESDDTFRYRVGVTSQIKKIHVKEGAIVKKGDTLIQFSEGPIVRTPIDGVVTQLDTKESETVFPNINLITVMNLEHVALTITLEQASAIRVHTGLPVRVQFESVKGTPLNGTVRSVYPKDGQFVVKVDLKDTPSSILPGMTADTAIIVGEKDNALLAPVRSIQRGFLTIRENGHKKKIQVKLGFQDSEYTEILDTADAKLDTNTEVWVSKK